MTTGKAQAEIARAPRALNPITGIGSLPHHNVDAALEYSFRMSIPFLPQIPIRNPWEFMIPQALEGLPGLEVDKDGVFALNREVWKSREPAFGAKLARAFAAAKDTRNAFEEFEPSAAASSSWQPFLWELEERRTPQAKIQLAGPLTSQWVLCFKDGGKGGKDGLSPAAPVYDDPLVSSRIFQLVLARSLAMIRRLSQHGIQPLFYLDEPGLYVLLARHPRHLVPVQELKIMIQTLRKEGAQVGLHCCSNTDWDAVLSLGLDVLSLDAALSLESLVVKSAPALETFLAGGGRLSLGIIPTGPSAAAVPAPARAADRNLDPREIFRQTLDVLGKWPAARSKPELLRKTLREAIFTPACGLALHSSADAEWILEALEEFRDFCAEYLG